MLLKELLLLAEVKCSGSERKKATSSAMHKNQEVLGYPVKEAINDLNFDPKDSQETAAFIKGFRNKSEQYHTKRNFSYKAIQQVSPDALQADRVIFADYTKPKVGCGVYKIVGFTNVPHSDTVKFKSIRDLLKAEGKDFGSVEQAYMLTINLDNKEPTTFTNVNGKWALEQIGNNGVNLTLAELT